MQLRRTPSLILFLCMVSSPSFAVTAHRDAGAGGVVLRANVPMGTVVGTGDRVSFEYQTREAAAVLVFNIDSQGYVHLLHPTGPPEVARALSTYPVPAAGAELVVDAPTGVEFVFALAVDEPTAIDATELDRLRATDAGGEPYRIEGDPFIAANMIAGELVRGVSHRGVSFAYTYFYVNDRVEYPCYLCGACDGSPDDRACDEYRVVQTFDRRPILSYPLERAYQTVALDADVAQEGGRVVARDGSDVDVNFYPYGVEARAVDPFYTSLWSDTWWFDPLYWYGPYYPYYGSRWSIGIGWGWGWGWGWGRWGGYYCSGWYAPCGWYDPWCGYPSRVDTRPERFKAKYKSASLTSNRTVAAQRDGQLRIASKDVRNSLSRTGSSSIRSKTGVTRGKGAIDAPRGSRVKTSIGGRPGGHTKAAPRSPTSRVKSGARGTAPPRKGIADVPRGGGGYKSRGVAPSRGGTSKGRGSVPSAAPRVKSGSSRSGSYAAPPSGRGGAKGAPGSAPPASTSRAPRSKGR